MDVMEENPSIDRGKRQNKQKYLRGKNIVETREERNSNFGYIKYLNNY